MSTSFARQYFDNKTGDRLRAAITPNWKSTEAHLRLLDVPQSAKRVLEIGCGIGRLLREIAQQKPGRQCWGYDASAAMVREAQEYCAGLPVTIEQSEDDCFPLPPYKVDFAFAWLVFQHIADAYTALRFAELMASATKNRGRIRIQLLANDEKPGNPLWVWHDPEAIKAALIKGGCKSAETIKLTERWVMVEGRK